MSDYKLIQYTPDWFDRWNTFIDESNNGTIFHRLDFLDYHKKKFNTNEHHLIWLKGDSIIAVMPMAIFREGEKIIAKSPYGASFGGLVYNESCSYDTMEKIYDKFVSYLKNIQVEEYLTTPPPYIYYRNSSNYFEFILLKNGGTIINSDLTAYIPVISNPFDIFKYSARKATNKANSKNVFVKKSDNVESFYNILLDNRRQLNLLPTHTYEDIEYLKSHLPEKVFIFIATVDNIDIAATLVFKCNNNVLLDFYWAHLEQYQSYRPINALVHEVTRWAFRENIKFFDFGTQTLNMEPNVGGTRFKESFGSNGIFRHTYKLIL